MCREGDALSTSPRRRTLIRRISYYELLPFPFSRRLDDHLTSKQEDIVKALSQARPSVSQEEAELCAKWAALRQ